MVAPLSLCYPSAWSSERYTLAAEHASLYQIFYVRHLFGLKASAKSGVKLNSVGFLISHVVEPSPKEQNHRSAFSRLETFALEPNLRDFEALTSQVNSQEALLGTSRCWRQCTVRDMYVA